MSSKLSISLLCFVSVALGQHALAQGQYAPSASQRLTPGSASAITPSIAPAVAGALPAPMNLPSGGVMAVSPSAQPELKYRDPSHPITVNEMSELAAKKHQEDFLQRQGYTTVAPAPKQAISAPKADKGTRVSLLGLFGRPGSVQAEVSVDGRVMRVAPGVEVAPGVTVLGISTADVQFRLSSDKAKSARSIRTLRAGESFEVRP